MLLRFRRAVPSFVVVVRWCRLTLRYRSLICEIASRNYRVPARVILAVMSGEIFKCFERVCYSISKEERRMPLALGAGPDIHSTSIIFEDEFAIH
jgi:hypothetical protein